MKEHENKQETKQPGDIEQFLSWEKDELDIELEKRLHARIIPDVPFSLYQKVLEVSCRKKQTRYSIRRWAAVATFLVVVVTLCWCLFFSASFSYGKKIMISQSYRTEELLWNLWTVSFPKEPIYEIASEFSDVWQKTQKNWHFSAILQEKNILVLQEKNVLDFWQEKQEKNILDFWQEKYAFKPVFDFWQEKPAVTYIDIVKENCYGTFSEIYDLLQNHTCISIPSERSSRG